MTATEIPLHTIGDVQKSRDAQWSSERATVAMWFTTPGTLSHNARSLVRILQRNDQKTITGSVSLELVVR